MTLLVRGKGAALRKALSFAGSACLHGGLLAWMVLGPPLSVPERRKSIYDQEIKPGEKKIVWYSLKEKLPDISPTDAPLDPRPPRAAVKAKQTIVSGPKDEDGATQRIWMPAPEVATPKPLPLPNVIAVSAPKIAKPFVAPPDVVKEPKPTPPPVLPEAPKVTAAAPRPLPIAAAGAKPKPLAFTPPPEERMQRQALLQLPDAPVTATVVEPNALPFDGAGPRPQPRAFTAPPGRRPRNDAPVALPNAPEVASAPVNAAPGVKGIPRTFVAPPSRPTANVGAPAVSADAPVIGGPNAQAETALAIVGLNPANMTEVPAPPGSHAAGFSAGPELRPAGGAGKAGGAALLGVPGLMVRGGADDAQSTLAAAANLAPTSRENLLAAAHTVTPAPAPPKPPAEGAIAPRVSEAPDPRLAGRVVYTVAIQMPNVTSFSGSWLVWFAEHAPVPGAAPMEIKSPVPLHKVDPKYVAAAAAERIEGKVRLFGVIRKDGHVDGIALIQHLDVRLDRTAADALAQWVFEPALRNGRPLEVDAVFEIPFHLAPRATK